MAMERDLSWERPAVQVNGRMYWHNRKSWTVRTNRHPSTGGNSWGWIEGPDAEIQWSNDGGSGCTEADAERVAAEHNDWLNAQVPHDMNIIDAVEVADAFERDAARLRTLLAEAENNSTAAQNKVREAIEARAAQHDAAISAALIRAAQDLLAGDMPPVNTPPHRAIIDAAKRLEAMADDYGGVRS